MTHACDPNFGTAQLGAATRWTPVKNLTFSGEVIWTSLDQKFTGAATLTAPAPKPQAVYNFADQNIFSALARVQRNF